MAGRKNSTFAVTKVRLGDGLQIDTCGFPNGPTPSLKSGPARTHIRS